ncbi:MAG: nucleotidyltransferase family protein [Firmicutes bacterium]|nr:nucleotidyltransferase family protein [Bacillota bacterium]
MKAIILAAGYATRMYPLTKNFPKPLLEVGGKTIIDHLMAKVERVSAIDGVYIVTNHRFYDRFINWADQANYRKEVKIIDDRTTSNEDRLGAIADLYYVIENEKLAEDLLVMAGDNLFDFEITAMVDYYWEKGTDIITTHEINDIDRLRRTGVIQIDAHGKVLDFEEKPVSPKSNLAVPPFYIYQKDTAVNLIKEYLDGGNNPDAPGNFIPWLIKRRPVHAFRFEGERYDIGALESYYQVKDLFEKRLK